MWGRIAIFAAVVTTAAAGAAAPAGAAGGCTATFPDVEFAAPLPAGAVTVRTSGVAAELAARLARDVAGPAELIHGELGGLDGVEVCAFAGELPLDSVALGWPAGQRLRAVSFGPERALVLSAWQVGLFADAAALGLAHQAEWAIGDGHYPDPLGGAVAQWYAARLDDRLPRDHAAMRYANLVRAIPEDIPWTEGAIPAQLLWNPEFQLSPIGDFVDHVVRTEGLGVLRDPDPAALRRAQQSWQRALLAEATGSETGTKGWIGGVIVVGLIVTMGLALAMGGYLQHRRQRRARTRETVPVREPPAPVGSPPD